MVMRDTDDSAPFPTNGTGGTTVVASTVAATGALTAPVDEIIPGFAATDDLEVFATQLEDDPLLVGTAGQELADALRRLLDEKSVRKQRDQAAELSDRLTVWVDRGELDGDIAEALDILLAPLADKSTK